MPFEPISWGAGSDQERLSGLERTIADAYHDHYQREGQGLIAQNFDRQSQNFFSPMVDGTVNFMSLGLRAGEVISAISIVVTAAGATLTLSKVGLYKTDGTRLALSANQGTAWESAGIKTVSLTSPYTVTTSGCYYAALVSKGATLPTLLRGSGIAVAAERVGSGIHAYGNDPGQTDLPANALVGAGPSAYWVGLS